MKYILYNNDNEQNKIHFDKCLKSIKKINNLKKDVIYNSSFPRLKQSKYRGIQAFKQLIKTHYLSETKNDISKFMFNEAMKIFWLKMYKIVYKYNAYTFEINGNDCIIMNDINDEKIKKYLLLDDIEILDKEPNNNIDVIISKKNYIKIMADYIIDEGFTINDTIELFKIIFGHLGH